MFRPPEEAQMQKLVSGAEKNYTIQPNDYLSLEVYTKNGERLIDPDLAFIKDNPTLNEQSRPQVQYLVDSSGTARFPMIGLVRLEGLTIRDAEKIVEKAYQEYYNDVFVVLKYLNKRVTVLGAGGGEVVPLAHENMRLTEVLAMVEDASVDGKASVIRIVRGNQVYIADLSSISSLEQNNPYLQPGDVVYVEPVRRPFAEALRDYGPIVSLITSVVTLVVVIISL